VIASGMSEGFLAFLCSFHAFRHSAPLVMPLQVQAVAYGHGRDYTVRTGQ